MNELHLPLGFVSLFTILVCAGVLLAIPTLSDTSIPENWIIQLIMEINASISNASISMKEV